MLLPLSQVRKKTLLLPRPRLSIRILFFLFFFLCNFPCIFSFLLWHSAIAYNVLLLLVNENTFTFHFMQLYFSFL